MLVVCLFILMACLLISQVSWGCSGIRLMTTDKSVVYARTMEFQIDCKSEIIAIPRNTSFVGTLPNNKKGLRWKNKYGIPGANGFNGDHVIDGMNEKGLALGLFYFPHHADYQPLTTKNTRQALAPWELSTYLLSNCVTIQDVRKALSTVSVVPTRLGNYEIPAHYVVHDAQGNSLVIEYIKGTLITYDNPLGIITNAPSFDWHMTNLRNYLHLFTPQVPNVMLKDVELFQTGQGSNFLGLPGDFTPPSRFVRLAALSQTAYTATTAADGLNLAINIINNITIPKGSVIEKKENASFYEYTQWVTIFDLTNKRLYYRTYDNHCYHFIDAKKLSFKEGPIKRFTMKEPANYVDYTNKLQ
jgi:choloylglycine hydrolase